MLLVSPTLTQPPVVVKGALKMFEGELGSHGIELEFDFEASYKRGRIDWVMIDPSRVTQILVNLMTNAIKFTKSEEKRQIKVSIGASVGSPPIIDGVDLEWFPSRGIGSKSDLTLDREWGEGESVFIYFAVEDTGRGLSSEEKGRLFHRFAVFTYVQSHKLRANDDLASEPTHSREVWRLGTRSFHFARAHRTARW